MAVYYIWYGIVACLTFLVVSCLKQESCVTFWSFVSRILTALFFFMFYWFLIELGIISVLLSYINVLMAEIFESIAFIFQQWAINSALDMNNLILHVNRRAIPINPDDPSNKLLTGFNANGTNQPLAGNIASELNVSYSRNGSGLSVQDFLVGYFYHRDMDRYIKLIPNPNESLKGWNLSKNKNLRKNLTELD